MRPIETTYIKNGYKFVQIKREGLIAIYEQRDEETDKLIAYEVFEIQEMKEGYAGPGRYFQPAREVVPSATTWGMKGFTCSDMESAEKRFQELKEKVENRVKK